MEREDFVRAGVVGTAEYEAVLAIADDLFAHLDSPASTALILEANQPGRSSAHIQNTFLDHAQRLGFGSESKGLFREYPSAGLRPDYYLPLGDTGILLEVERGKTTINNMNLLDFWKCHICVHAHYLILLVPTHLLQNETMTSRKEFASVRKRLAAFFDDRNYTNVRRLFLFGY